MKTFKTNKRHPVRGSTYNGHYRTAFANVGVNHPDYRQPVHVHLARKAKRQEKARA